MPPRAVFLQMEIINRNNLFRNNNNDVRYPLIHMRDHLFHAAFVRFALIYARIFSERERKFIEFLLLTLACLSLVLLSYIHMAFVQTPTDCLAHVADVWPRDGILRVEILKEKLEGKYTLEKSYLREKKIKELEYIDLPDFFSNFGIRDKEEDYKSLLELSEENIAKSQSSLASETFTNSSSSFNATIDAKNLTAGDTSLPALAWTDDEYIMEFSLEYGFLKLSPSIRKQYNISVLLVTLNPETDKCFGGALNNLILYNFLGYDEVLLASLKLLASKEDYEGYVRNVLSEVEFIFVNAWMDKKSYITAGFVMMVFTISISILLRYSHHQIFVFIVELLHMLEFQSAFNFPAGPLLTVILALVGMEAIMSEFFNDTAIAFYVILIVWMADQYDTICCKSIFTKKHWLRFFYLYHFFFYAYSYRFGHNRFLALLTSWIFTLHSMVYFFHRYELPALVIRSDHDNNNFGDPPENAGPRNNTEPEAHSDPNPSSSDSDRTESSNASNSPDTNTEGGSASDISTIETNNLQSSSLQPNLLVSKNKDAVSTISRNLTIYQQNYISIKHGEDSFESIKVKSPKQNNTILEKFIKEITNVFWIELVCFSVICLVIFLNLGKMCTHYFTFISSNTIDIIYS